MRVFRPGEAVHFFGRGEKRFAPQQTGRRLSSGDPIAKRDDVVRDVCLRA
jgi:hypothetical protein